MILAQATTHANSLYHEWGLMSTLIGLVAVMLPVLWWLHRTKTDRTVEDKLRVRSVLAEMFQQTVFAESRKIFQLVQSHLAYSLSQVDSIDPQPSAFDKLCRELRELDEQKPDRNHYRAGLERAFAQVVIVEVEKLLQVAESHSASSDEGRNNPTGLRVNFEGETERKLTFLAQQTVRTNKTERTFDGTRVWAFRLFASAAIAAVLVIPGLFWDTKWADWACTAFLAVTAGTLVAGIVAWIRFHNCQRWFEVTANRYRTPGDWMSDLARTKTR